MRKHKLPVAMISLFALSGAAGAAGGEGLAAGAATRFFETHPNEIDLKELGDALLFANRQVGLEFKRSAAGLQLTRLYGIAEARDFLAETERDIFEVRMTLDPMRVRKDESWMTKIGAFNIIDQMEGDDFTVGSRAGKDASWRREGTDAESVLHLEWKQIDVREDKAAMDVEVTVRLRAGDPLSYWRINVRNRGRNYGIARVRLPLLTLAPIGKPEDNSFLYPRYRGDLIDKPFERRDIEAFYPHNFNMQFQALYNRERGGGVFLGTRDPAANFMCVDIAHRDSGVTWRLSHFPPNITFAGEDFALPYDCVVGPFRGDWFDACQIYREWAVKQFWCRKGTLAAREDIPAWYKESPLIFYTDLGDSAQGTHSLDENQRIAADHFREFLKWTGLRLPANWYEYQTGPVGVTAYDIPTSVYRRPRLGRWAGFSVMNLGGGNYPRMPALSGLAADCKRLREEGGMVCPYIGLELFDPGPAENSPYAAEGKPHMVRDLYGAIRRWSAEASWQACVATPWWRERLRETCVLMMERENVSGFYLDVMQGCGLPCYWTPHGHSAAGGDSMTRGMHELVETIADAVKAKDPEAITTGENASENMIDVTDGILQVALSPENTAPIFAAVYQDYITRYGLEISVGKGDAFFIECASLFVEGAQIGRLRLRPRSSALSFQEPEHKEMLDFLGRMVDYYKQDDAKSFLAYGRLMRPIEFREPSPMPMLRYQRRGRFPVIMSGVFRSESGQLGVFVVNAGSKNQQFKAELDLAGYGFPPATPVDVDAVATDGTSRRVFRGAQGIVSLEGALAGHGVTMFRIKQGADREE